MEALFSPTIIVAPEPSPPKKNLPGDGTSNPRAKFLEEQQNPKSTLSVGSNRGGGEKAASTLSTGSCHLDDMEVSAMNFDTSKIIADFQKQNQNPLFGTISNKNRIDAQQDNDDNDNIIIHDHEEDHSHRDHRRQNQNKLEDGASIALDMMNQSEGESELFHVVSQLSVNDMKRPTGGGVEVTATPSPPKKKSDEKNDEEKADDDDNDEVDDGDEDDNNYDDDDDDSAKRRRRKRKIAAEKSKRSNDPLSYLDDHASGANLTATVDDIEPLQGIFPRSKHGNALPFDTIRDLLEEVDREHQHSINNNNNNSNNNNSDPQNSSQDKTSFLLNEDDAATAKSLLVQVALRKLGTADLLHRYQSGGKGLFDSEPKQTEKSILGNPGGVEWEGSAGAGGGGEENEKERAIRKSAMEAQTREFMKSLLHDVEDEDDKIQRLRDEAIRAEAVLSMVESSEEYSRKLLSDVEDENFEMILQITKMFGVRPS